MAREFKLLVVSAEKLSDDFTQVVAVIDGVCWELDSALSAINKDAHGYRIGNAANVTGGPNYVKGELEEITGRARELFDALKPARELAAKWAAEDFANARTVEHAA